MKSILKRGLISGGLFTGLVLLSGYMPAFCNDLATLSAVQIEGNNGSFNIILKTSHDVQATTKVSSADRLVLELIDTKAANLIRTSFKKANNIDDVIVQPSKGNNTRLFISGKNVAKSKIIIDSTNVPLLAEKYASENDIQTDNTRVSVNNSINEKALNNETVSADEFLNEIDESPAAENEIVPTEIAVSETEPQVYVVEDNTAEETATGENINVETIDIETTGVVSSPPEDTVLPEEEELVSSDSTDIQSALESELFRPAADLEVPASGVATTIKKSQGSAAAATSNSLAASTNSLGNISGSDLVRFAIVFVFVTILVAYLRKENIISFRLKKQKTKLNAEHLDIYRSLHKSTSPASGKLTSKSNRASNMDRVTSNNKHVSKNQGTAKTLTQHSALKGYATQNRRSNNLQNNRSALNANSINRDKNYSSLRGNTLQNTRKPSNNVEFLQRMAEHYEQAGRHDLAMNIQKNIRKSLAKT